jgi:Spy/CpxP family protein refolding chaperone
MKAGKWLLGLAAAGFVGVGSYSMGVKAADTAGDVFSPMTQGSDRPLARLVRGQIGRWMVLRSEIDLSDDQKQQIGAILQSHKAEIVQAVQPIVQDHRALREAVLAQSPDEKTIRSDADNLGHAVGDAAVLATKIHGEIAPILTDEQRQEFKDFRSQSDHAVDDFFAKVAAEQ